MYYITPCPKDELDRAKVYTAREIGFPYDRGLSQITDDDTDGYLKRFLRNRATYVNFILAQNIDNGRMNLGIFYPHQTERECALAFQYYLLRETIGPGKKIPEREFPRDIFQNSRHDLETLSPLWGPVKLMGGGQINEHGNNDRLDSPVLDAYFGVPMLPRDYMAIVRKRVLQKLNVPV